MAKQEAAPAEAAAPKKGGKLKIIILAVVGVLLLAVIGVGALLLMPKGDDKAESAEVKKDTGKPPVYETLAVFTVNLADPQHYLQTELQLAVADVKAQARVKERMPEVRDAVIRLLSSKTMDDLTQADGKDRLAEELRQQVNDVLGAKSDDEGVRRVLFGSFIIQ